VRRLDLWGGGVLAAEDRVVVFILERELGKEWVVGTWTRLISGPSRRRGDRYGLKYQSIRFSNFGIRMLWETLENYKCFHIFNCVVAKQACETISEVAGFILVNVTSQLLSVGFTIKNMGWLICYLQRCVC
jgi:hypothetical protein